MIVVLLVGKKWNDDRVNSVRLIPVVDKVAHLDVLEMREMREFSFNDFRFESSIHAILISLDEVFNVVTREDQAELLFVGDFGKRILNVIEDFLEYAASNQTDSVDFLRQLLQEQAD